MGVRLGLNYFTLQLPSSKVNVTKVSGAFCVVRFLKCDPFNSSTDNRPRIKFSTGVVLVWLPVNGE